MKDLSIITVTYNDENVIKEFADSLAGSEVVKGPLDAEVVAVDNDSRDGTVAYLRANAPFIRLIASPDNLGFSKANNHGLMQATGKYVLFLNPDTAFSPGVFTTLLTYMDSSPEVGAVTAKVLLPDGTPDVNTRRSFPTPWVALKHFLKISGSGYYILGNDEELQEIPACGGAFLLVRREVLEQIGEWDEDFFLYGEDLDFCYRIRQAGWKIMYNPNVSITHYGGVSTGIKKSGAGQSIAGKRQRRAMADHSVKAMALFYRKHLSKKSPWFINWLVESGFFVLRLVRKIQFSL